MANNKSKKIYTGIEAYNVPHELGITGVTHQLKAGYDSSNFVGIVMDSDGNWKIEPNSAPGAGQQAVTIGAQAVTTKPSSNIAIGYQADASDPGGAGQGSGGVAIGNQSVATGDQSVALGTLCEATKWGAVAIGWDTEVTSAFSSSFSIGIGYNASVTNTYGLAMGRNASSTASSALAIGRNTSSTAVGAMVIGYTNSGTLTNSTTNSIGFGWSTSTPDFLFSKSVDSYMNPINPTTSNIGIGLTNPNGKLHIQGGGSTSATNALIVENSSASAILTVRNDGVVQFGGGHQVNRRGVSGNGTTALDITDYFIRVNPGFLNTRNLDLPASPLDGQIYMFRRTDSIGTAAVRGNGKNIKDIADNTTTYTQFTLGDNASAILIFDSGLDDWLVVSKNGTLTFS